MIESVADGNRDLIDVPVSELRVTAKGRQALADGKLGLVLPGFDPELALDLLLAVACWEDSFAAAGPWW
jgi:hypothetical protein